MSKYIEAIRETPVFNVLKANGIKEAPSSPDLEKATGIYYTDIEGPAEEKDYAAILARLAIRPTFAKPGVDYGGIFYDSVYDFYTAWTAKRRTTAWKTHEGSLPALTSSEGTDIGFLSACLLASGVNMRTAREIAEEHTEASPGAKENIDHIRKRGLYVVASTTSFKEINEIILQKHDIKVDHVIGTPFPLDDMEHLLRENGRYHTEIAMLRNFLNSCFPVIEEVHKNGGLSNTNPSYNYLQHLIADFYQNHLGISFDPNIRETGKIGCPTLLGTMIEETAVVTDLKKAEGASLFNQSGKTLICVGDGLNDAYQLQGDFKNEEPQNKTRWSIAPNGHRAVKFADIGVITNNMAELSHVVDCVLDRKPEDTLDDVIKEAQSKVDKPTIIHRGGRGGHTVPQNLIDLHRTRQKEMRGDLPAIP